MIDFSCFCCYSAYQIEEISLNNSFSTIFYNQYLLLVSMKKIYSIDLFTEEAKNQKFTENAKRIKYSVCQKNELIFVYGGCDLGQSQIFGDL